MNRIYAAMAAVGLSLGCGCTAQAQMGMNLFQKPAIAKFVNPVVGKGSEYLTTPTESGSGKTRTMEMGVIGKESVDGKEGFWMQISSSAADGKILLAKALISKDDFQPRKIIFQMPGQGAMEMPFNPSATRDQKMADSMSEWHSVGTETITVPAGTFVCEHWRNDTKGSDMWASDKVTPFGMVKEVTKSSTMVLTKQLTDVTDKIPGPVQKFDPQMMMQQHQKP
jgi:hypothetical protein